MQLFKSMLTFALACAVLSGVAQADYRSEFKAYQQAFAAGDIAGALRHGEAAWRAAEAELGDQSQTAVLAYNYAFLAVGYTPSKAVEPYRRALELTRKGVGPLDVHDVALGLAEVELLLDLDDKAKAKALEKAISEWKAAGANPVANAAGALKMLATYEFRNRNYKAARDLSDDSIDYYKTAADSDPEALAESLIISGAARFTPQNRKTIDLVEASIRLNEAISLFGPQRDIDTFDRRLAQAVTFRATVEALAKSLDPNYLGETGSRISSPTTLEKEYNRLMEKRASDEEKFKAGWRWATPKPDYCSKPFDVERVPPKYPKELEKRLGVGSTMIGFDTNENKIIRTVILSDISGGPFSPRL